VAAGLATILPRRNALAADPVAHTALTSDQALALLKKGNDEYLHEAPYAFAQGR
jgi:hypothetical protein